MHPKAVAIELDGQTRHLLYDGNAMEMLEDRFQIYPLDGDAIQDQLAHPRMGTIKKMLYVGLLHEAPDLTLETVGAWMHGNLREVSEAIGQAIAAAVGATIDPPDTPGEAPASQ